jgi:hypothetical protein
MLPLQEDLSAFRGIFQELFVVSFVMVEWATDRHWGVEWTKNYGILYMGNPAPHGIS